MADAGRGRPGWGRADQPGGVARARAPQPRRHLFYEPAGPPGAHVALSSIVNEGALRCASELSCGPLVSYKKTREMTSAITVVNRFTASPSLYLRATIMP